MPSADHIPSFNHLRTFVADKAAGRKTHVAADRQQVEAPSDGRVFAHYYEKLITALLLHISRGSRGSTLEDAVHAAPPAKQPSYNLAARGLKKILDAYPARDGIRRQRSTVVRDADGYELVSIRTHVELRLADGSHLITYLQFSPGALSNAEMAVMETAVALAARQANPSATPAVALVREGKLVIMDVTEALSPDRIAFLRAASAAYRAEWDVAA